MGIAKKTAERIIGGERLSRQDDLGWFANCDLDELQRGADAIRRHYLGDAVDLCTIVNARSGLCGEDCRYCAQSSWWHTSCEVYGLMDAGQILEQGLSNQREGVDRFAIVTSGRTVEGGDFERALEAVGRMHDELRIGLCASLGTLTREQLVRLRLAGVTRYHHNIETSRRYFPLICTTHTFNDRLRTIRDAAGAGLEVCSGGIIGMGENWEDRADMAFTLFELGVLSIPLNVLIAIPGTPLQEVTPLPAEEILRCIAMFRYMNPEAHVRMAGGRSLLPGQGRAAFEFGASAAITGNMLTTTSSSIRGDREMLERMGRDLV